MRRAIVLVGLPAHTHLSRLIPAGRPVVLGRSGQCDFVVDHPSVSRRHAELSADGTDLRVADLGSRNGTFVEDKPVAGVAVVKVGRRVRQLRFGGMAFVAAEVNENGGGHDPGEAAYETPFLKLRPTAGLPVDQLSEAQRRVFDLLTCGLSEKCIAARLGISRFTVHNHVVAIYRALGVHSRPELLALALPRMGPGNEDVARLDRGD